MYLFYYFNVFSYMPSFRLLFYIFYSSLSILDNFYLFIRGHDTLFNCAFLSLGFLFELIVVLFLKASWY